MHCWGVAGTRLSPGACLHVLHMHVIDELDVVSAGGYTMRNVARCWCYETGRMLDLDLPDNLPEGVSSAVYV